MQQTFLLRIWMQKKEVPLVGNNSWSTIPVAALRRVAQRNFTDRPSQNRT